MTHIPGFKYEIFISYPRECRPWAREFHSHLRNTLDVKIPSKQKPRIFFDDNDWGGQDSAKLLEAARNSAIFLAIVSPAYVANEKFTLLELEAFCNASEARRSDPLIFSIEHLPIASERRPSQLKNKKRYQFWIQKTRAIVPLTLGATLGEEAQEALFEVAEHISERLKNIPLPDPLTPIPPITDILGGRVLLGQVTNDLLNANGEVRDYLQGLGLKVLPQAPYPKSGPKFRAFFQHQLLQLKPDLFVQLLSEVASEKWDDEEESCAQFQRRVALAHFHQTRQELITNAIFWRSPAVNLSNLKQHDEHHDMPLLESAQAMTLQELKDTIKRWFKELEKKKQDNSIKRSKPFPFVYITASKEDQECAERLQQLAVGLKCAAKIMEEENPAKDFEERVRHADAVIFSYGNARHEFVNKWVQKYFDQQYLNEGSAPRERIEALYRSPPSKQPPPLGTDWPHLRKCGSYEEFNPECMKSILGELTEGNAECSKCGSRS